MIVSFLNQKGGVGKTTLATHLAGIWSASGRKVVLVDADPQGSALDWWRLRTQSGLQPLFEVVAVSQGSVREQVHQLAASHHHIVLDGPPGDTAITRAAVNISDLVLMPVQPSPYDIWASETIIDLVHQARERGSQLQSAYLINRRISGTVIGRDISNALTAGIPALKTSITQRVIFPESAASGRLVWELDVSSPAVRELAAMVIDILEQGK